MQRFTKIVLPMFYLLPTVSEHDHSKRQTRTSKRQAQGRRHRARLATEQDLGVGCNFDEVEILFRSHFEGFLNRVDPVFTLGVYNPDLRGADVFVDARSSSFSDGGVSLLVRHVSKVAVPKDSYNITHEPLVWSIPLRGFRGGCD